jgi:hypothetical protein
MNKKLRESDARAVDLILDRAVAARGNGNGGNGGMFAATMTASHVSVSNGHVGAVEKVLHLLDAMPATEPASDLVQRTLDRIAASNASPMRSQAPSLIDIGRPHA